MFSIINKNNRNIILIITLILGVLSLIIPVFNSFFSYHSKVMDNKFVNWTPNFILLVLTWIIRFILIDVNNIQEYFINTSSVKNADIDSKRFIDFMFIAMHTGVIATITIYINFLLGAFFYLLMHIQLIISFSGITTINFKKLFSNKPVFYFSIFSIILWLILIPVIFFCIVYEDKRSFVFIPYAYVIGFMNMCALCNFFYLKRPLFFRIMLISGGLVYLVSDIFIGTSNPENGITIRNYLINPTYVAAIFLLSFSVLYINQKAKKEKNKITGTLSGE